MKKLLKNEKNEKVAKGRIIGLAGPCLNGYGYFLTDPTDLPKPTNSESFQLLCFSSDFD